VSASQGMTSPVTIHPLLPITSLLTDQRPRPHPGGRRGNTRMTHEVSRVGDPSEVQFARTAHAVHRSRAGAIVAVGR
jgi:hypothetical protein